MYDMKNLAKVKTLGELAPEAVRAFLAFNDAVFKDGAIPVKYKELIAVAVAVTTQCPYCIEDHAKRARKAGASDAELAEATMVAAAMRAGGGVAHATHVV
jgi:AhpD family alkylhydroperoxidase